MPTIIGTDPDYGHKHRTTRTRLLRAAIGTPCPGGQLIDGTPYRSRRCTLVLLAGHADLDHTTRRIICHACNRGSGAVDGNRARGRRREPRRSRHW